jgi:hypothetical protein
MVDVPEADCTRVEKLGLTNGVVDELVDVE